jgi:TonB family protein
MLLPRRLLFPLTILALFPVLARSQGPMTPPPSSDGPAKEYQDSPEGLRWQLQDILNAARDQDISRLKSLVRQTEIPNSEDWFIETFGRDPGKDWAEAYRSGLAENEENLEKTLTQLAGEDGEFMPRNINGDPAPARKIEESMVDALQRPLDIFYAGWKIRGAPEDSKSVPIGYFVFIEGRFRWDGAAGTDEIEPEPASDQTPLKEVSPAQTAAGPNEPSPDSKDGAVSRPGVGGIGYPSCDYCPDPAYTRAARSHHLQGIVVLRGIIQTDGSITDIQVLKSPDPELTEIAIEAVNKWHMNPAHRADGEPVPVLVPFEIEFRLVR